MKSKQIVALIGVTAVTACTNPTSIVIEPLRVINWSPASGSFCIETDVTIYATFSDDVQPETLTADSFFVRDSDTVLQGTLAYDEANFTAQLTPDDTFEFDRIYTVVATTEIRSAEKGRLPVELAAAFRTVPRSGCTPGVECSLPSDCVGRCPGFDACVCANTGSCMPECSADIDCYRGTCGTEPGQVGMCIPDAETDGGEGDPGPGGDPLGGD